MSIHPLAAVLFAALASLTITTAHAAPVWTSNLMDVHKPSPYWPQFVSTSNNDISFGTLDGNDYYAYTANRRGPVPQASHFTAIPHLRLDSAVISTWALVSGGRPQCAL